MSAGTMPPPVVTPPVSSTPPVAAPVTPPVAPPAAPSAAVPEWLKDATPEEQKSFGQYASRADLLKAHNELRTKLGQNKPAGDDLSITPNAPPVTGEDLAGFIKSAGLSTTDIQKAWSESGQLTTDQYKSLAGKGIGRAAVDTILAMETELRGYKAKEIKAESARIVGGEQQLNALINWGKQDGSLTADERDWYNAQVANPTSAARAVEWLNGKYTQAVGAGRATPLVEGGAAATAAGAAYTSRREFLADRNNPEYKEGTAHFNKVQARMRATPSISALQ